MSKDPIGRDDYLFGRRQTWWIFSLFCILMVFDFADRMVIAAILPSIKETWDLSDAQSGLLSSALFLCMVLFALPASTLIDRWSRTRTGGLMGIVWSVASGAGAFAASFPQLLFTRAVVGAGEAGYLPAGVAWLSAAFPQRRRQLALGILLSSQSIGTLLGLIAGGIIAAHFGWRHALGLLAIPGLIVALLLYRSRDYRNLGPAAVAATPSDAGSPARHDRRLADAATNLPGLRNGLGLIRQSPSLWLVYLALALVTLSSVPIHYFMPTLFHRVHGVPLQEAAYLSSAVMLVGALAAPIGGWYMDRRSHLRPEGKLSFTILAFGLAALFGGLAYGVVDDLWTRFSLMLLAAFVGHTAASSILTVTQELVPQERRAFSSTCCIITAHLFGSAPGPWIAGLLSDRYGLETSLLLVSTVAGTLSAIVLLVARHHYTRDFARSAPYRLAAANQTVA